MCKIYINLLIFLGVSFLFYSCNHAINNKNLVKDNISINLPENWIEIKKDNVLFAFKINSSKSSEYFKFLKIDRDSLRLSINEILCESHNVWKNSKKVKYWGYDMNKISFNNSVHYAGYLQMIDKDMVEFILLFCLFEHDGFIYRMELGSDKSNLEENQVKFQEIINSLRINGKETILLKEITGKHERIDLNSFCKNLMSNSEI